MNDKGYFGRSHTDHLAIKAYETNSLAATFTRTLATSLGVEDSHEFAIMVLGHEPLLTLLAAAKKVHDSKVDQINLMKKVDIGIVDKAILETVEKIHAMTGVKPNIAGADARRPACAVMALNPVPDEGAKCNGEEAPQRHPGPGPCSPKGKPV